MSKFKVGDRVRVKKVEVGATVGKHTFVELMLPLCGQEGVVIVVRRCSDGEGHVCGIDFDDVTLNGCWVYADKWLELIEAAEQESLESLDLVSLLNGCVGVELWSPIFGNCKLTSVEGGSPYCIEVSVLMSNGKFSTKSFTAGGRYLDGYLDSACVLWPSRDCQTWDGWVAPRWRAEEGETYWFISTSLEVSTGIENLTADDEARWKVGNYFCSPSGCEAVIEKIKGSF